MAKRLRACFYDSQRRLALMVVITSGGVAPWWLTWQCLSSSELDVRNTACTAACSTSKHVQLTSWRRDQLLTTVRQSEWFVRYAMYHVSTHTHTHTHTKRHRAMTMCTVVTCKTRCCWRRPCWRSSVVTAAGLRQHTRQTDTQTLSLLSCCCAATLAVNMSTYNSEWRRSSASDSADVLQLLLHDAAGFARLAFLLPLMYGGAEP